MDLETAITTRRSIRDYKKDPIDEFTLREILKLSLWAPSGRNRQPWYLVIVRGRKLKEVKEIINCSFEKVHPSLKASYPDKLHVIATTKKFFSNLGNAPCIILTFIPYYELEIRPEMTLNERWTQDHFRVGSISAASLVNYNITLLAHERGLGSCWLTGPLFYTEEISGAVGVRDKELISILTIGYPKNIPSKGPKRKENVFEWIE